MRSWRTAAIAAPVLAAVLLITTTGCGDDDKVTAEAVPTAAAATTPPSVAPPTTVAATPEQAYEPEFPETTTPPTKAAPSGDQRTLFDLITIVQPDEWTGTNGDADSQKFVDSSGCMGVSACPKITFLLLTKGTNKVNYMPDPIGVWTRSVTSGKSACRDNRSELGSTNVDGVMVKGYKLSCQGVDSFAWYAPGKKLLIMAGDGEGYAFPLTTMQDVLATATWN